jgi:hypothetical protein
LYDSTDIALWNRFELVLIRHWAYLTVLNNIMFYYYYYYYYYYSNFKFYILLILSF